MKKKQDNRYGFFHPLVGSSLSNYLRVVIAHFPYTSKGLLRCLYNGFFLLFRIPHSRKETRLHKQLIARMPMPENPIFIIGHARSGTTHLHNLLSQDNQFKVAMIKHAYFPWDFLDSSCAWTRSTDEKLPETRSFDQVRLKSDAPQEEEAALGNMGNICSYYTFYFPKQSKREFRRSILLEGLSDLELKVFADNYCYLLKKIMLDEGSGKRLLLKNPANTAARIGFLKRLFPKAKFIHIYRNPFDVFVSTIHHVKKTLPDWALQTYDEEVIEPIVLENYRLMYQRFFKEAELLPDEDLYQLPFESLESNPMDEIVKIYEALDIPGIETARPLVEAYYAEIKDYRKNNHSISRRQIALVKDKCAFTLERWGYDLPSNLSVRDED